MRSSSMPPPYSRMATVSPSCTVCPSATLISFTLPALGASTGISIFMDSSTMTRSPAATASPTLLVIWKTTPVMCALTSSGIERSLLDELGMHAPLAKLGAPHDPQMERDRRLDALDHESPEGRLHAGPRLLPRGARGDQLGQQRVVVYRNLAAFGDPAFQPDAGALGRNPAADEPWRGHEVPGRILGVYAALDARAALDDVLLSP